MVVGRRIKAFRESKHMTQEQLAKATEFSQSYISGLEQEKFPPSLKALGKIAKVLGVPITKLLDK